jgi:hypothetical protein
MGNGSCCSTLVEIHEGDVRVKSPASVGADHIFSASE